MVSGVPSRVIADDRRGRGVLGDQGGLHRGGAELAVGGDEEELVDGILPQIHRGLERLIARKDRHQPNPGVPPESRRPLALLSRKTWILVFTAAVVCRDPRTVYVF